MNYLIMPPSTHYDGGFGITACNFHNAAETLKKHGSYIDGVLPLCYLHRHTIELFLKSIIYILHKKYSLEFSGDFSIDKPAILVRGKWVSMENTHNISDLYTYFDNIYSRCKDRLPSTTCWDFPEGIKSKINLVSGTDPKSTFFRYPNSGDQHQDEKKSKIQKTDLGTAFNNSDKPVKLILKLDENDNVVESYDMDSDALAKTQEALNYLSDFFYGVHAAFRGELTNGT